jgi:hypothetical protein
MKTFTDLEQSKKLTEILPLESADMGYIPSAEDDDGNTLYTAEYKSEVIFDEDCIPCWSLAALLDILKDNIKIEKTGLDQSDIFTYSIIGDGYDYKTYEHRELIDACYEMIVKLHEKNELVI